MNKKPTFQAIIKLNTKNSQVLYNHHRTVAENYKENFPQEQQLFISLVNLFYLKIKLYKIPHKFYKLLIANNTTLSINEKLFH